MNFFYCILLLSRLCTCCYPLMINLFNASRSIMSVTLMNKSCMCVFFHFYSIKALFFISLKKELQFGSVFYSIFVYNMFSRRPRGAPKARGEATLGHCASMAARASSFYQALTWHRLLLPCCAFTICAGERPSICSCSIFYFLFFL